MSDIQFVKEELDNIDDKWKQARFDSLPHVVEILTCKDPEEALQHLRDQRDEIEELVDDVVRGYHNGFNRAIHNYSQVSWTNYFCARLAGRTGGGDSGLTISPSFCMIDHQILRLFSESAASISGLKKNLGEARNLLGTRHKQLQQLWYRSVTLRHVISLLDQIDNVSKVSDWRTYQNFPHGKFWDFVPVSCGHIECTGVCCLTLFRSVFMMVRFSVQVPARIDKLIAEKRYYAAVQLHVQSISMLEREGIQTV